ENLLDQALAVGNLENDPTRLLFGLVRALEPVPEHAPDLDHVIRANVAAWRREVPALGANVRINPPLRYPKFSPDGRLIAAWSNLPGQTSRVEFRLWDVDTGKSVGPLPVGVPRGAAFSPDSKTIVTGGIPAVRSEDSVHLTVRRWDVATGQP